MRTFHFRAGEDHYPFTLIYQGDAWQIKGDQIPLRLLSFDMENHHYDFLLGDLRIRGNVLIFDEQIFVFYEGQQLILTIHNPLMQSANLETKNGTQCAPMPGKITQLLALLGQNVKRGPP